VAFFPREPKTLRHVGFSDALGREAEVWVRPSPPDATNPRAGAQAEGLSPSPGGAQGLSRGFGGAGAGPVLVGRGITTRRMARGTPAASDVACVPAAPVL
jgi:hypothetical protein